MGQAATKWREAFGVRRIPALLLRAVRNSHIAPEYGALQTLRALVCQSVFSLQMHSKNLRENDRLCPLRFSSSQSVSVPIRVICVIRGSILPRPFSLRSLRSLRLNREEVEPQRTQREQRINHGFHG